ncbi:armadillo-type protein [Mycena leptocephala]|nr:armadillo-type protein [Mycena leptocephala]
MLADSSPYVRYSALKATVSCLKHDDLRLAIPISEAFQKIISMLADENHEVQKYALEAIAVFLEHDGLRMAVPILETFQRIVSRLTDTDKSVRQLAYETVVNCFLKDDNIRVESLPPETFYIFIDLVKHNSPTLDFDPQLLLQAITSALRFSDIRSFLSTATSVTRTAGMLNGHKDDSNIIDVMQQLIMYATQGTEDTISVIGITLTHELLQKMGHVHPTLRGSYVKLILQLPASFTTLYDDALYLICLLKNSDAAIVNEAARITRHFSDNYSGASYYGWISGHSAFSYSGVRIPRQQR